MDATLMAFLDFIGEDILVGQNVILTTVFEAVGGESQAYF